MVQILYRPPRDIVIVLAVLTSNSNYTTTSDLRKKFFANDSPKCSSNNMLLS
ncbi:hypothetical protein [Candidatus Orientia mediorientalis]|uniref:hypothetical protein n=1 Tax=Candidatus Orientia mediorientalis TaxID=911112 RepID=UPI0012EB228D|nr:hypothetical protein [Candidatus Orientia mediorientalis]